MPTARELLEQADALMRRNRTRQVDTEIPELTEVIPMPVIAPEPPVALDDIPELTDAVEEIEIASIVEIPDDDLESSAWLRSDDEELAADTVVPPATSVTPAARVAEPIGGRVLPLFAIAGKPQESAVAAAAPASALEPDPIVAVMAGSAWAKAPVVELPVRDAPPAQEAGVALAPEQPPSATAETEAGAPSVSALATPEGEAASHDTPARVEPAAANDSARWEALAEEIQNQVLQRIDLFTDTGLREQLSLQIQPIVERASAEMVATINAQVGTLLRACIADAIEREIEKRRESNP